MNWISTLQLLQDKGIPTAVVTIVKTRGSTPRDVGTKMLVTESDFYGTIGGGQLEELVLNKARDILNSHQLPQRIPYPLCLEANQCCGGFVEVFIETVNTGPTLLLFGAGHVAQAVANILAETNFLVHMIDPREEWLAKAPPSARAHLDSGVQFLQKWKNWHPEKTYAVVMTYDHDLDQAVVENLLDKPAKYLGLIGSDTKWRRFQARMQEKGITSEMLARITCPIGFEIGGKSPQEVAISFAAQIVQMQNEAAKATTKAETRLHVVEDNLWLEELK